VEPDQCGAGRKTEGPAEGARRRPAQVRRTDKTSRPSRRRCDRNVTPDVVLDACGAPVMSQRSAMTPRQPPRPVNIGSARAPQRVTARLGRIRALVRVILVALLARLGLVAVAPAAMADGLWNFHPVTYNMQGSGADGSRIDKWRRDVEPLLANHDVIALQEAGAPPASAVLLQRSVGVPGARLWRPTAGAWAALPAGAMCTSTGCRPIRGIPGKLCHRHAGVAG